MESSTPSTYSISGSPRSALHSRVSLLLSRPSPETSIYPVAGRTARKSRRLRLALPVRTSSTRPASSIHSVIDPVAPATNHVDVLEVPPPTPSQTSTSHDSEIMEELYASPLSPLQDQDGNSSARHSEAGQRPHPTRPGPKEKKWSKLFSAKSFKRNRVRAKAILSIVFGITLLVTLAIYLTLAATGIGSGLMFHLLFIVFILSLTAVFCHSLLMMCLLILGHLPKRPKPTYRGPREWTNVQAGPIDDIPPEKPIPIVMAIDEEAEIESAGVVATEKIAVRPPPPVYGIWRGSTRMNPNLVHWQKLPPSPLTPTYDEAINDIQRAVGYRPPSYISEGGVIHVAHDVDPHAESLMASVHPLERERVAGLIGEAR